MRDIICCFLPQDGKILDSPYFSVHTQTKKARIFCGLFCLVLPAESRLWRRAPMNSGCPLFSLPVYGRYQLAFLANRSLLLASPPSIPAVLFCAYANKKSPHILRTFLFGTPGGNRTHNGPLGGGCYIHLTTEAYKVLIYQRFPPRRVSAAFRRRKPFGRVMNGSSYARKKPQATE